MYNGKEVVRNLGVVVIVVLLATAIFLTISPEVCSGFECFSENMVNCKNAVYVNEEPEASWGYEIVGRTGGFCDVEVTLLQAKRGELGIDRLEGNIMTCSYPLGVASYPEKNLNSCHGLLKEGLLGVVIERIHGYVLNNLDEIKEVAEGV